MLITQPPTRELDHRDGDGYDVTLLWHPDTDLVSVAVVDERTGEVLMFNVDGADALPAFHHPYAYAPPPARPSGHSRPGPQSRAARL